MVKSFLFTLASYLSLKDSYHSGLLLLPLKASTTSTSTEILGHESEKVSVRFFNSCKLSDCQGFLLSWIMTVSFDTIDQQDPQISFKVFRTGKISNSVSITKNQLPTSDKETPKINFMIEVEGQYYFNLLVILHSCFTPSTSSSIAIILGAFRRPHLLKTTLL